MTAVREERKYLHTSDQMHIWSGIYTVAMYAFAACYRVQVGRRVLTFNGQFAPDGGIWTLCAGMPGESLQQATHICRS